MRIHRLGGPGIERIGLLAFSQIITTRNQYRVPGTRFLTRYLYCPSESGKVEAAILSTTVHFRLSKLISMLYDEISTDAAPASGVYGNQLSVTPDVVTKTTWTAFFVTGSSETANTSHTVLFRD